MNTIILATLMSLAFPSAPTNAVIPEASITIPLGVDLAKMESLTFSLELVPNATNNLEVALGFDTNADGILDLDECDRLFGYDCGAWFEKVARTGAVTTSVPRPTAGFAYFRFAPIRVSLRSAVAASAAAGNSRLEDAAGEPYREPSSAAAGNSRLGDATGEPYREPSSAAAGNSRIGDAAPEAGGGTIRHRWTFRRRDMDFAWNALRLTRRGWGELDESATVDAKHVSFVFILK